MDDIENGVRLWIYSFCFMLFFCLVEKCRSDGNCNVCYLCPVFWFHDVSGVIEVGGSGDE